LLAQRGDDVTKRDLDIGRPVVVVDRRGDDIAAAGNADRNARAEIGNAEARAGPARQHLIAIKQQHGGRLQGQPVGSRRCRAARRAARRQYQMCRSGGRFGAAWGP
jgi:hypothetical protein